MYFNKGHVMRLGSARSHEQFQFQFVYSQPIWVIKGVQKQPTAREHPHLGH
jgi:hypothetical protein